MRSAGKSDPPSVRARRSERELFFWSARELLKLTVWTALTIYFLISLIQGRLAGYEEILDLAAKVLARFG